MDAHELQGTFRRILCTLNNASRILNQYYLQLLRGKLYDQFFSEMKNGGMLPFMDAEVYGRSLMECSSFIASSAFPDPSIVGQGFLARLSGSTAEFLDIWKVRIKFLPSSTETEAH